MQQILILGAGIGSAAMILNETFPDKDWHCTFVDTDSDILALCAEVMQQFPNITAQYCHRDAIHFLKELNHAPHLICVDIFDEHVVPKQFLTENFLKLLRKNMSADSIAIMNVMFASELQEEGFKTVVETIFPQHKLIPTTKNQIFIFYAS